MKMRRFSLLILAVVLLLALAVGLTQAQESAGGDKNSLGPESAEATVSAAFTYQGVLQENGVPVNGSRDMVFELYATDSCDGFYSASLTKNGVLVNDGSFHVYLDFGQGSFDGDAFWLRVVVAGTEIGCQELTVVPYALSLRPGATVRQTDGGYALQVVNLDDGDGIRAYASGTSFNNAALFGANSVSEGEGSGVYGLSYEGSGVYAHGYSDLIAALRATNDNGPAATLVAGDDTYGMRLENAGTGDGLRSISQSPGGAAWASVYAYNNGTGSGIYGGSTAGYAGYFGGHIYVDGNCNGCLLVYTGLNSGETALAVGDLVAVQGVATPLAGTTTPLMRLAAAGAANSNAIIGVVQSAGQLVSSSRDNQVTETVVPAAGPAAPGSYLFIAVQGMAQVKVAGPVAAGERVTLSNGVAGAAAGGTNDPIIGRAVESSQQGGLVWVMLDIR